MNPLVLDTLDAEVRADVEAARRIHFAQPRWGPLYNIFFFHNFMFYLAVNTLCTRGPRMMNPCCTSCPVQDMLADAQLYIVDAGAGGD